METAAVRFPFSFRSLSLPQTPRDDPHVSYHHRDDTNHDHVFHVLSPRFLLGFEIGSSATSSPARSTQPGHGWPQRSQLQPPPGSGPPGVTLAGAAFCNISLTCAVSSVKKRVVFKGLLLLSDMSLMASSPGYCARIGFCCANSVLFPYRVGYHSGCFRQVAMISA